MADKDLALFQGHEGGSGVKRVSRGILEDRYERMGEIATNLKDLSQLEELVKGLKEKGLTDSHDYSKVLHRNGFRPSRPLGLVGLGFYGPHKEESAIYDVTIFIEDLRSSKILYSAQFNNVFAKRREIFWVHFEKVYHLDPNRLYNIAFQLDGPVTGKLNCDKIKTALKDKKEEEELRKKEEEKKKKEEEDNKGKPRKDKPHKDKVELETLFHFFEGNSLQMPEMEYVVLH